MNTFELITEEGKNYLKVITVDMLGNDKAITYKHYRTEEDLKFIVDTLLKNIESKLGEVNAHLTNLPSIKLSLENDKNQLLTLI